MVGVDQLRMDGRCFIRLCHLLTTRGVSSSRHVSIEEKVASFLYILSHHKKNRVVKVDFIQLGKTVSRYFNTVLNAMMTLYDELYVKLEPITEDCLDNRWHYF